MVVVAASIAACAGKSDSAAVASDTLHAAITDSAKGPGVRDGTWRGADAHSSWHATLNGPRITQLDEVALHNDSTRAMRQFRFDSAGTLAAAREVRTQVVFNLKATPDTINTLIELEWQADSLLRSAKRVNGEARMLQPYEVDNLRAHADELVRIARAGSSSKTPGH